MTRLFASLLFLGFLQVLQGQGTTRFSVHLAPQFAWFNSDEGSIQNKGSIFQLQYGLQMDRFFEKNYAFSLGFGVNNLGGNLLYSDSSAFVSRGDSLFFLPGQRVKHAYKYLEIPLGLKLKTEELGYLTFYLQIGFNPMINIEATVSSEDDLYELEGIRESVHVFNLGYHAGVGVEYRLGGTTALTGGLRWTAGLTDVTDHDDANVSIRALSIHLGLLF